MLVDNGDTYTMRTSFVDGLYRLFNNTRDHNKPFIIKYKGEWILLNTKEISNEQYQKVNSLVKYLNSGCATQKEYASQVQLTKDKSRFWDMIP